MRQLDTCDFCGAAADGVYEVLPASVAGDPKRLALCTDCRTTLQSVVDPLLDAAESTTTAPDASAGSDASTTAGDTDGAASTTAGDSEMDADGETVPDSGTAVDDALDAAGDTDDSVAAAPPDEPDSSPADHTDGITIEAESESVDAETAENGDATAAEGTETRASETARTPRPDGYAQIVRLLQNRDGAMPREHLRVLATNAYDIGGRQFEDAVDAAVDNGDVEETADGLRTV